jgi:prophage maintenance system killer protein
LRRISKKKHTPEWKETEQEKARGSKKQIKQKHAFDGINKREAFFTIFFFSFLSYRARIPGLHQSWLLL